MARKEKKSKWGTFLVFFIAFIMVSSVIGFLWSGVDQNESKYNNIKFTRTQSGWTALIEGKWAVFDYFPSEVEPINISSNIGAMLANKPEIDTTSFINDTFSEEIALAQYNMALVLNNVNIYLRTGFTANNTFKMPVFTCEDATPAVPIIYFMQSNQTLVSMKDSCVVVEARNADDILRVKDRLLYSILGIIR